MDLVRSWRHLVVPGRHLGEVSLDTAGWAEHQLNDLRRALQDPQIGVVWLGRGGLAYRIACRNLAVKPL